ncbi:hypothetical protein EDB85DRAFT_1535240 [Lactarius pseudohatsudake]|nr:hypothetical protein EDB85DRAFT_1535240 [Lactarius pseudohatsudake]
MPSKQKDFGRSSRSHCWPSTTRISIRLARCVFAAGAVVHSCACMSLVRRDLKCLPRPWDNGNTCDTVTDATIVAEPSQRLRVFYPLWLATENFQFANWRSGQFNCLYPGPDLMCNMDRGTHIPHSWLHPDRRHVQEVYCLRSANFHLSSVHSVFHRIPP